MEQLVIHGGNPLRGRVKIGGAKNAVLPIIAAALLGSRGVTVLEDVPALEDVYTICAVLQSLGVRAEYEAAHHRLHIDATKIATVSAPYELVRKMRASFLIMGPLLAREVAQACGPQNCASPFLLRPFLAYVPSRPHLSGLGFGVCGRHRLVAA